VLNDTQLQEIETTAIELARAAGLILLDYFKGPLKVDYKSANNRNPVTDADHAADEYLRNEIAKRYPSHGIVTEETDPADESATDIVWVIDPLDGTSNFLNGLPLFGVLIAVLEHGIPVVAAIFIPDIHNPAGRILHAHKGGGAFDEDIPLDIADEVEGKRRMSTWPSYFLRMYTFRNLNRRLGDVRALGSAGYELAQAAKGVLDYVNFNGLFAWDLAAGLLLVQEAGGTVLQLNRKTKRWAPFTRFSIGGSDTPPTRGEIKVWRGVVLLGRPAAVAFIAPGLGLPTFRWRRFKARANSLIGRGPRR
jgi:myo-inositol-1(or 4)-monophosphatase